MPLIGRFSRPADIATVCAAQLTKLPQALGLFLSLFFL
jgi:hypothetical protein